MLEGPPLVVRSKVSHHIKFKPLTSITPAPTAATIEPRLATQVCLNLDMAREVLHAPDREVTGDVVVVGA